MAHSFLIFDFGGNEEAAQQARHRIDGWKQGFRLDKKLQVKFERKETGGEGGRRAGRAAKDGEIRRKREGQGGRKIKIRRRSRRQRPMRRQPKPAQIRLIVRLDFSDHEKLSHQRWIERIPAEEPFKSANPRNDSRGRTGIQSHIRFV